MLTHQEQDHQAGQRDVRDLPVILGRRVVPGDEADVRADQPGPLTMMTVPATSGGKNRTIIENGFAMSRPNTPTRSAPYTAGSPYCCATKIIGLSKLNDAATTGSRTPKI